MRHVFHLALLSLLAAPGAQAGPFVGTSLTADGSRLTIEAGAGPFLAPKTDEEQQGFGQPRVSGDGRLVGWLALDQSCCASYPLPLSLVVLRADRSLIRFEESPPVWAWKFENKDTAVAYRQRTSHGTSTVIYKLVRIRDRKLLGQFECYSEETPEELARLKVPDWVWSIADECPAPRENP